MRTLDKKWQQLLYAVSGLGINMLNLMMGSYLCSALLVGGFGEAAIPFQTYAQRDLVIPAAWAIFVLIAKIIDGVIDVPLASLTDSLRTRWGRRRPSIVLGFVPLVAAYLLFLVIPGPAGVSWLNTIYFGLVLCVFYTAYTLTMVTYYATFTEIVKTESARSFISNVKSVCDIVYFVLGYVVVRMLLNGLNIRVVALIVLPLALTMLIPLFMIKEPSTLTADREKSAPAVNLVRSLTCTAKNRPFMIWMCIYALMTFGVQLFLGGINEYFSYTGMSMIFVMSCSFAPVPFALILYNRILRKRRFGFAFRYALITFGLGMLSLFGISFLEAGTLKTVLSLCGGIICSLSVGALFSVAYSVPSQLAAEEQERTGVANAAMYFAVQGLFSGVATGIATGVVLTALKGSEETTSGAIIYMTLISAIGVFVAAAATCFLPKSITTMGGEKKTAIEK